MNTKSGIEPAEMQPVALAGNAIPAGGEGVKAIVELAKAASYIELVWVETEGLGEGLPDSVPVVIDPRPGGDVKNIASVIEAYRQRPKSRAGNAKATTLESFSDLVNRHKTADSVIFAKTQWPGPSLMAVIDYHASTDRFHLPGHLKHRITYEFPVTDELKAWIAGNGKLMEQAEFATFLEEHAAELAAPFDAEAIEYERLFKEKFATPNELISLSRNLEIYVGAKVKRGERLQSGERTVEFVEEHTNGRGERVEIPGVFMVAVPAFLDGEPVRLPARLRYRIAAGSIHWGYQLYRWEFWLRNQVQTDLQKAAKATGLPAFEGAPEA